LHDACRDDRRGHGLIGALLSCNGLGQDHGGDLVDLCRHVRLYGRGRGEVGWWGGRGRRR
jgi:hypothetical protein